MTHHPLVSIVTPSYNGVRYIEETLSSVLGQDYPNIEYIVIDGGSRDGSVELIRRYEKRLAYWSSEPDRGMYHAINKGIARATGEIVAYLNSDDLYFPDTVSRVVSYFTQFPDADLLYGWLDFVSEDGELLYTQRYPEFHGTRFINAGYATIGQPAAFWRRRLHDRIGLFNEELQMASDFEFFYRAGMAGKAMRIEETLARFRVHGGSKTSKQLAISDREMASIRKSHMPNRAWFSAAVARRINDLRFKALNWRVLLHKAFKLAQFTQ